MKNNKMTSLFNNSTNKKGVSEKYLEPQKLGEEEKKILQVKDGQHNHYVDERGGN
ncbi:hypothetical protein MHH81_12605 [Psychrobacillus sp. FSL H8-0484]|uniref:hypothetical protein n=1 Tax=unclassified Psychrobacillus TaxID=2636677 RepID=UPI0030F9C656